MRNIKLEIEYAGTDYCGWQLQSKHKSKKSIQGTIEKSLQRILQEKVRLISAGRTDAGVHAFAQVANFKTSSDIPLDKLQKAANSLLPDDIKIIKVKQAGLDFHSRFNAKSKLYRYIILNRVYPSAFLKDRVYFYRYPLDAEIMRKEAKCLLGRHDFKAFCASGSSVKDTVRTIRKISVKKLSYQPLIFSPGIRKPSVLAIEIEADGFLYNMVRNIAGSLIEIGRSRFPLGSLKKIILSKDRRRAGPTLPACGLYLVRVKY